MCSTMAANMIRIFLLSLLLLEVSLSKVDDEHSNQWASLGRPLSSDGNHLRRVRDAPEKKTFGESGNYITTVISCDIPTFPDCINVGFASDKNDKFSILFNHVQFSQLSSTFALLYRIDLDASVVQILLRLGKARINGTYCLSTPTSPNTAYDNFEMNLYAELIYTHNIAFHVDDVGKPTFGKTESHHFSYKKAKGNYANVPSALSEDLHNYLSPKLLEAIIEKIHEEISAKVDLEEVAIHVQNEIAFRYRNQIGERFREAIENAFSDVHINTFNILYHDKTNFNRIVQNYEVRIPSFVLRDVEKFFVNNLTISYIGEDVYAKGVLRITAPLAIMKIVYRDLKDPLATNHTFKAEYQIWDSYYDFELLAKPKTGTVEVTNIGVHVTGVSVAPTQGLYGDERDAIILQILPCINAYYPENGYRTFAAYTKGLVAEGRIAYETFK